LAKDRARIAAAWTRWSAARTAFQRNRLVDRSAGMAVTEADIEWILRVWAGGGTPALSNDTSGYSPVQ
jgi:hypothetical protein